MTGLNLYSPVISAKLYSAVDDVGPLDLTAWSDSPEAPFLKSIEIKKVQNTTNGVSITLSGPYERMQNFISDNLAYFSWFNTLSVQIGYSQGTKTRRFFLTTDPPSITINDSNIELSIKGHPGAQKKLALRESAFLQKGNDNLFNILREVLDYHGIVLMKLTKEGTSDKSIVQMTEDNAPDVLTNTEEVNSTFAMQGGHREIVEDILRTVGLDYYYSLEGFDQLVVIDWEEISNQKEGFVFKYRDNFSFEDNTFPILSWDSSGEQNLLSRAAEKVKSSFIDHNKKEKKSKEANNKKTKSKKASKGELPTDEQEEDITTKPEGQGEIKTKKSLQEGKRHAGEYKTVDPEDAMRDKKLFRRKWDAIELAGVQATFETIGLPFLQPGMKIKVEGVTPLFDGEYKVLQITHTGDGSGYKTKLKVHMPGQVSIDKHPASEKSDKVEDTKSLEDVVGGDRVKSAKPTTGSGTA